MSTRRPTVGVIVPFLNEERYLPTLLASLAARRFESQGSFLMSVKWIGIELHRLLLGEIRGEYFRYFK